MGGGERGGSGGNTHGNKSIGRMVAETRAVGNPVTPQPLSFALHCVCVCVCVCVCAHE